MSLPTSFRRSWMILALSAFVLSPAQAQRVIHMVVPFGPGAVQDVIARTFNAELGRELGATVVVENRAGAGGTVGTGQVAKAAPDGNTLVLSAASHTLAGHLYPKLAYDPIKDFVGVSLIGYSGYVIAAPSNLGVNNLARVRPSAQIKTLVRRITRRQATAAPRTWAWRPSWPRLGSRCSTSP